MSNATTAWARLRKLSYGIVVVGCAIGIASLLLEELADRTLEHLLCGMQMQNEFPSPSRRHVAVVWIYDCGATTAFVTRISIMPHGRRFSQKDYPPFFSVHGYHEIVPPWHDDTQLSIGVPKNETIYIQEQPNAAAVAYTE
jgi:hypothetical protein